MQGVVVAGRPVGEIVKKALEQGLIVLSAGSDVLRFVPPLIITKEDIDADGCAPYAGTGSVGERVPDKQGKRRSAVQKSERISV